MGDFSHVTKPKTLKPRRCPECAAIIPVGERYARMSGAYDGDFYSAIQCLPCHAFGNRLLKSLALFHGCSEGTFPFGDMLPHAAEHLDFEWGGPCGADQLPSKRDAMLALFDEVDATERRYQAEERARRKASARRQLCAHWSRLMIMGMSRAPTPPALNGRG